MILDKHFVNGKVVDHIENYKFVIGHDNIWGHLKNKKHWEIKMDI